ncbi:ANTAR domain-containing protein [Actinomycetospora straminea]|uniref:ANTAR domain-containing protein n=1 Tax=Actinomycetospora straminea TaxID=663607 RepID=A0ABP9EUD8_9PSEU|nr:ANTAR domain-containing protein [Actinomycetospora straminea]MDD7936445.1 ANTAR domain-containing protein [Actinomycetospora straminea]
MTLPDANDQFTAPADVYRAEGALIERLGLDADAAGRMLRREAALRAIDIVDVAREVLTRERSSVDGVADPWGSC